MKNWLKKIKRLLSNRNQKLDLIILQNQKLLEIKGNEKEIFPSTSIKKISKFKLLNKNKKELISFNSITEKQLKKNLPQIPISKNEQDNISGFLSSVAGGTTNVALTSMATQGLFRATANPETLMKLANGGVGSAVVQGGKITQQAGFVQAGSTMFTPMIVFQLASIVTGQYYMNNISKQLNSIQEKLDELLHLFHIERQAKLVKSFQFISEYLNKKTFVLEDFVMMKIIISDLANIREEYFLMMENSFETIKKNNLYANLNSLKEAKKIALEFEKTGFLFKMKTSLIADELYHLSKVVEFHMNLCYKNPDINRINLIANKLDEINSVKHSDISFTKTEKMFNEIKTDTIGWLEYSKKQSWFNANEIETISNDLNSKFKEIEKEKKTKLNKIMNTYKVLKEPFYEEKQILIDNRNGKPKLFVE